MKKKWIVKMKNMANNVSYLKKFIKRYQDTHFKQPSTMSMHPGFKSVQNKIAQKSGMSKKKAGAVLATSARKASPAAKRANPRLKKVAMPKTSRLHYKRT